MALATTKDDGMKVRRESSVMVLLLVHTDVRCCGEMVTALDVVMTTTTLGKVMKMTIAMLKVIDGSFCECCSRCLN